MEKPKRKKPNLKTPKIILKPNKKPKPTAKAKANKKKQKQEQKIWFRSQRNLWGLESQKLSQKAVMKFCTNM